MLAAGAALHQRSQVAGEIPGLLRAVDAPLDVFEAVAGRVRRIRNQEAHAGKLPRGGLWRLLEGDRRDDEVVVLPRKSGERPYRILGRPDEDDAPVDPESLVGAEEARKRLPIERPGRRHDSGEGDEPDPQLTLRRCPATRRDQACRHEQSRDSESWTLHLGSDVNSGQDAVNARHNRRRTPRNGRGRARDPRRGWLGRRRRNRGLRRVLRCRDRDDRPTRWWPRDRLRRLVRSCAQPRLLRRRSGPRRGVPGGRAAGARRALRGRVRPLRRRNRLLRRARRSRGPRGAAPRARAPPLAAARRAGLAPGPRRRRVPGGPSRLPGDDRAGDDDE